MEFRRKVYRRGSSFETTVPMPLLLTLDHSKKYDIIFSYDQEKQTWAIRFESNENETEAKIATNSEKTNKNRRMIEEKNIIKEKATKRRTEKRNSQTWQAGGG